MARLDGDADHAAAASLDDVAADDRVFGPVSALHQHVRLQRDDPTNLVVAQKLV